MSIHNVNLNLSTAHIADRNRDAILDALKILGTSDCDFSGENGLDYLWEAVWMENGYNNVTEWKESGKENLLYESNLDYVIELIRDIEDDKKCVETFFDYWLKDDSYYKAYEWEIIKDNNENWVAIALATVS